MIHFRWTVPKAYFFIAWTLFSFIPVKMEPLLNNSFDKEVIKDFLKEYVKPYVQTLRGFEGPVFRLPKESDISAFVKKRVNLLKEFLQDDSVPPEDDKLTLEGEDETTIIEFLPQKKENTLRLDEDIKTKDFKEKILRFKILRNKIKKALKKESVTIKTKSLVTTTLDDMIKQMIGHQCIWRDGGGVKGSMAIKNKKIERSGPFALANTWKKMWENLKKEYLKTETRRHQEEHPIFLNKFQDLISVMTNDLQQATNKYKIVCHYETDDDHVELPGEARAKDKDAQNKQDGNGKGDKKTPTAENKYEDDEIHCNNFKLCTEELIEYLLEFFKNLNDTAISTVRNYGAMFLRDVNDDSFHEKERITGLINRAADESVGEVIKAFKKNTKKLKLDKQKNKYSNIRYLYRYVSRTMERVKKYIHVIVQANLVSIRKQLMETIQKDIDVNLDVDLGNLEREFNGKICPSFEVCNGKYFGSRRSGYVGDKHSVYVKVQLDMKDDRTSEEIYRSRDVDKTSNDTAYKTFRIILTRSPYKLNVTRTLPQSSSSNALKTIARTGSLNGLKIIKHKNETHSGKEAPEKISNIITDTIEAKSNKSNQFTTITMAKVEEELKDVIAYWSTVKTKKPIDKHNKKTKELTTITMDEIHNNLKDVMAYWSTYKTKKRIDKHKKTKELTTITKDEVHNDLKDVMAYWSTAKTKKPIDKHNKTKDLTKINMDQNREQLKNTTKTKVTTAKTEKSNSTHKPETKKKKKIHKEKLSKNSEAFKDTLQNSRRQAVANLINSVNPKLIMHIEDIKISNYNPKDNSRKQSMNQNSILTNFLNGIPNMKRR